MDDFTCDDSGDRFAADPEGFLQEVADRVKASPEWVREERDRGTRRIHVRDEMEAWLEQAMRSPQQPAENAEADSE